MPAGRSRMRVNRKAVSATQGSGRGRALHGLLARGSRHRQRRPQRPARGPRRRAGGPRRGGGPGRRRDRAGPAPAGRAAPPVRRPGQRGGHGDPRRLGPEAGRRRQGPRGRPRAAGGGPRSPGGVRLRPPGRRGGAGGHGPALRAQLGGRPPRCAGRPPDRRPAPGRQHGRAPPRRPPAPDRGPGGPDPRLTGRATLPRPGAAPGGARADPVPDDAGADAAARRRVLGAGPGPEPRPGGRAPVRPGHPHHGGAAARGHRGRPAAPRREPRGPGDGRGATATAAPAGSASRCPGCSAGSARHRRRPSWRPCSPAGTSWSARSSAGTSARCAWTAARSWWRWNTRPGPPAARMESGQILARLHALGETSIERLEVVVERA